MHQSRKFMRLGTIETIVKYTSSNQDAGNLNTLFPRHDITTAHIHLQLLTLLGKQNFYLHNETWCLIETKDITIMSNLRTVMFVVLYAKMGCSASILEGSTEVCYTRLDTRMISVACTRFVQCRKTKSNHLVWPPLLCFGLC